MSSVKEKMTALADAIRDKTYTFDLMTIDDMTEAVKSLSVGGSGGGGTVVPSTRSLTVTPTKEQQTFTSSELGENAYYGTVTVNAIPSDYITTTDATAAAGDILSGKTAYVKGAKVTGTIPSKGYESITPGTSDITIPAKTFLSGNQVIRGDSDLIADNIKRGVTVFNVTGTFTADATASTYDILEGETAYVNGMKVTGNMTDYGDVTAKISNVHNKWWSNLAGYYKSIDVSITPKELTITPSSQKQIFNVITDEEDDVFYSKVTVDPIPSEYITTSDATAEKFDIIEGKTAYVNGEKVTGVYKEVSEEDVRYGILFGAYDVYNGALGSTEMILNHTGTFTSDATAEEEHILEGKTAYALGAKVTGTMPLSTLDFTDGSFTVSHGYTAEDIVYDVPIMKQPAIRDNVVLVPEGYNNEDFEVTVGNAIEGEILIPGTSDIVIPEQSYILNNYVIMGDEDLRPENIKSGVTIFNVIGGFTSDADATAFDIAEGKTAYVKGEKVTGIATGGGAVSPTWEYDSYGTIRTNRPPCNTCNVPARGYGNGLYGVLDGNLIYFNVNPPRKFDETINWTYVNARDASDYTAIGDGKLYKLSSNGTITPLFPSLSGITQVGCMVLGHLCCTDSGELYGGGGNDLTKVRRVEYTRGNSTDPIEYVNVSKILNCRQDYQNFWVITDDGSLASGWLDKEAFDHGDGAAYAEIDSQSIANGNPFVNYFPQNVDGYGGDDSTQTYELAFRSDGLWYRQAGTYYDSTDKKTKRYSWNKADDPGFRKCDWLGYCSMSGSGSYEGYDEETGRDIYKYSLKYQVIALHIDEQGRLWRIAPRGEIISTDYEYVDFKLTGLDITQVGEDTDWQCVPAYAARGAGDMFGQKGGKVLNMWAGNVSDTFSVGWEEYPVPFAGKMICSEENKMYFAPEGTTVDLSKAGGTY